MKKNNTINLILRKINLFSAFFFLITFFACKKYGELHPKFDEQTLNVVYNDTLYLKTKVVKEDSIRTDIAAFNMLGAYNDPEFGITYAGFATQFRLPTFNIDFGNNLQLDSIVLTLDYQSIYGDSNDPMTVYVYELGEELNTNNAYYSNYVPRLKSLLAVKTFTPVLDQDVIIGNDTLQPHLRIKLNNELGQRILNASGTSSLQNNEGFSSLFKGIFITTQTFPVSNVNNPSTNKLLPNEGSIVTFDLLSSLSNLTLYYSSLSGGASSNNEPTPEQGSLTPHSFDFLINIESVKYNVFEHDYAGSPVEQRMNKTTSDTTLVYVQSMSGPKTIIDIPDIKTIIKDQLVMINKAELVLTLNPGSNAIYPEIDQLMLVYKDTDGTLKFLTDYLEGIERFGGTFDESTGTYTFNISRHLHEILTDKISTTELILVPSGAAIYPNRSVLTSGDHPSMKMKLNLTYTKL